MVEAEGHACAAAGDEHASVFLGISGCRLLGRATRKWAEVAVMFRHSALVSVKDGIGIIAVKQDAEIAMQRAWHK